MRLSKLLIHGYRKLAATECRFTGKLTAIVGANEAGKSTLLDALLSVQNNEPIPASARPYGLTVGDDSPALEVWYRLQPSDLEALDQLDTDVVPSFYVVTKYYDGSRTHRTEPAIERRTAPRQAASTALTRFDGTAAWKSFHEDNEVAADALDRVYAILSEQAPDSELTDEDWGLVDLVIEALETSDTSARGNQAGEALSRWREQMQQEGPRSIALHTLSAREPQFAIFSEEERGLRSTYTLDEVADNPPAALRNMAELAGLDLPTLRDASHENDPGAVATAIEAAHTTLRERLNRAWNQSEIVVTMPLDGGTLHILAKTDAPRYNRVAEHSDGLRTFISLTAFAHSLQDRQVPLVLLIDEAEQHLHYDAQADLIRMLERQSLAQQVVYSTHSAGCLPSDLGTGVRGIGPAADPGRSRVTNSLWGLGPGFTPLLMALGAGAAAFAPSRYAVLGEGATEMLLLPSMIREAIGEDDRLDYQVAAGLAEVGNSDLQQLELEAPRVAYVVDGDAGGEEHATRLRASGVSEARITRLGGADSGLTLEDLVRDELLLAAINEVLEQLGCEARMSRAALLAGPSRQSAISAWCAEADAPIPGKPSVAVALLEREEGTKLLTRDGVRILRALHAEIKSALGI